MIKPDLRDERELRYLAGELSFDERANYHADIDDLKPVLLEHYLRTAGSELYKSVFDRPLQDVASDMSLLGCQSECRKPLNAALLLFSDHPEEFFPYAQIEVVDKPDPTGIGMVEKIFRGPLDRQLVDALAFIRNYCLSEYVTKVPDSALAIRAFNFPYLAVKEALCNAVLHKSYRIHEPVTVTVTPQKMEILSIPGPDSSITDEAPEKGMLVSGQQRNRMIGNFLRRLSLAEGRNTGVPRIIAAMKSNGSPPPSFETDGERSYFQTVLPVHPLFLQKRSV
jgi:ATP-dependent DNA helicase RecG